jgi:streptogramin lyase
MAGGPGFSQHGFMPKKPALAAAGGALALLGALALTAPASAAPTPVATLFPTSPTSEPASITAGPDGNLWFVETATNSVGKVTPAGVVTEYPVPTAISNLQNITAGPDGNLWFTEADADQIGRITPAGVITEFPLAAGTGPVGIVPASDGNLWFAEESGESIGVMDTSGTLLHEYPTTAFNGPEELAIGSDGNVWFSENNAADIGTIDIATGAVTDYPIAQSARFIALGSDGDIWYTAPLSPHDGGRISPSGIVTAVPALSAEDHLAPGPDGNMWAGDPTNGTIDTIDMTGTLISQFTPVVGEYISSLTTGPDSNIWFTEYDNVGVLNLNPPAAAPAAAKPSLASTGAGPWTQWMLLGGAIALVIGSALATLAVVGRMRRQASR